MGQSLYAGSERARRVFTDADGILGYNLSHLCFNGPAESLTETRHCQPALFVHGMAVVEVLREKGWQPEFAMALGLSLGELTALTVAGVFDFATGLRVVAERARLMQLACESTSGAMASLIGGSVEEVTALCAEFDVDTANLNCPGQIVISGDRERIAAAVAKAKGMSFKMVVPLQVAGAYHSRLMEPARAGFAEYLAEVEFAAPTMPVFSNVSGGQVSDPDEIRAGLVAQVVSPVRWEDCMRAAIVAGVTEFFECGPGTVLNGLGRRIDRAAKIQSLSKLEDIPART